jgi:hypothetical protein
MCDRIKLFGETLSPSDSVQSKIRKWTWNPKGTASGEAYDRGKSYKDWAKVPMPIRDLYYECLKDTRDMAAFKEGWYTPTHKVACIARKTGNEEGEFLILTYKTERPVHDEMKKVPTYFPDKPLNSKPQPKKGETVEEAADLVIRTSRVGLYKGGDGLNVTWKSGDSVFAPNRERFWAMRNGHLSAENYELWYAHDMRESFKTNRARWEEICLSGHVTLLCYCNSPDECHRTWLASFIAAVARKNGLSVRLAGEVDWKATL